MTDRSTWPILARTLAKLAIPADRGIGDVVHRHAAKLGGEEFKHIFRKLTGHDCGCENRQDKLNAKYPLQ